MPSSALANGETTRLPLWSVLATIVVCTAVKTSKADLFKNLQLPTMVLQVSISLSNTPTSLSLSLILWTAAQEASVCGRYYNISDGAEGPIRL